MVARWFVTTDTGYWTVTTNTWSYLHWGLTSVVFTPGTRPMCTTEIYGCLRTLPRDIRLFHSTYPMEFADLFADAKYQHDQSLPDPEE